MNFEFNKRNVSLLGIFILIIIAGLMLHSYRNPAVTQKESEKITLVKDYSRFFTISNAGNKYINYLQNKDKDNLILLLNDTYISVNEITKDNILDKLTLLNSGNYTFEARKMYQEILNQNITRYYVKGNLNIVLMDEYERPKDYYLIIEMDLKNLTFSVTPDDGKIFKGDK